MMSSHIASARLLHEPLLEPSELIGVSAADTIRILIATDSHVGYNERDPIRGDDSWKSFHEVMCLAKDQDVMVSRSLYFFSIFKFQIDGTWTG